MTTQRDAEFRRNPLARLALVIAGIGVVVVIVSVVGLRLFQSSQNAPLPVTIFAGAELVGQVEVDNGHRRELYTTSSPAEEVATFYRQENSQCTRIDNTEQGPDQPAFSLRCSFDASSLYLTRYTVVTVQPGVGDDAGLTLI